MGKGAYPDECPHFHMKLVGVWPQPAPRDPAAAPPWAGDRMGRKRSNPWGRLRAV